MAAGQETRVVELSEAESKALELTLRTRSFEFRTLAHARFSAKGEGVICNVYNSGKCVVQGAGASQFLENYLSETTPANKVDPDIAALSAVQVLTIGSDESGKGDYFGPMVVVAAAFGPENLALLDEIRVADSKTMTPRMIEVSARVLRRSLPFREIVLMPRKYNELYDRMGNVNHLLAWAHGTAIEELLDEVQATKVVIDGFASTATITRFLKPKTRALDIEIRPRAESNPAVAAASILASDLFTRKLAEMSRKHNLTLPKGAGSNVDSSARRLVKVQGEAILRDVAKTHFRNTEKVLGPHGVE